MGVGPLLNEGKTLGGISVINKGVGDTWDRSRGSWNSRGSCCDMETTKLAYNAIVPDILGENNYEIWKVCLKNFLLAEDLWDIVNGTKPKPKDFQLEFKTWQMKNAKALHAIQISCGPHVFSQIKELDSAKAAWDHLASTHQPPSEEMILPSVTEVSSTGQGITNNDYIENLPLFKAVFHNDWKKAKEFIDLHPHVVNDIISTTGETALHIAAISEHLRIVEELVELMPEKSLELKNEVGNTALHLVALCGITKMAEAMVKKNRNLLCIADRSGVIPVALASSCGHKDMVRYLYLVTPKEELNPETSDNGVPLLTFSIFADMYDIALDLLQSYPRLATIVDFNGTSAVFVLAQKQSAFPSGSQHGFWQRWIYSYTRPLRCKLDNQIDGKIIYIEIAGGGVAACNVTTMDVLATMSLRDNVVAGVGLTGNVTGCGKELC
ncbi:hypothetical protein HHK36_030515 [Tetracentron sinense]|uniref:DUF4219 domain-containing protein n=1 Tax=Tetracentron sinense TaxID=13715 RepID=A0A835CYR7_TETSI|nr:hypothetical protein HHK36_030515 [Tetracentron sinense]